MVPLGNLSHALLVLLPTRKFSILTRNLLFCLIYLLILTPRAVPGTEWCIVHANGVTADVWHLFFKSQSNGYTW